MRTWRFHEFGPIENLRLEEVPMPVRAPGEVLLQVLCASLNPADRYMIAGQYPRPAPRPFSVGRDCCGIVRDIDEGSALKVGQPVVLLCSELGVSRTGTLAEYVVAPEECLAPLPEGWTPEEGAAAPLVFLTAWQALIDRGQLARKQTVLVTGASGGVGTAVILLASALGARVIALSGDSEKYEKLRALGADTVVDSRLEGLVDRVKGALDGGRIDLVIDSLGGPYLDQALRLVGYGGGIVSLGLLAGLEGQLTLGLLIHKCVTIKGMSVSAYKPDGARAAWDGVCGILKASGARPVIQEVFAMESVPAAFARLSSGPLGKVCIMIAKMPDNEIATTCRSEDL